MPLIDIPPVVFVSVSQAPHSCEGRILNVRSDQEQVPYNEQYSNVSPAEPPAPPVANQAPEEDLVFTSTDSSAMYDDGNYDELVSFHDELEANLECLKIQHQHEIKLLEEKLSREKKLRNEAEDTYNVAKEDWEKTVEKNLQTRISLIKNTMQTFNIRRGLARQLKEQLNRRLLNGNDRA